MISVAVIEASQVAEARRQAAAVARRLGFDETASGRVALVCTELATNLVKYGTSGEILIESVEDEGGAGIQLIALDRGEGFANVDAALRDGHSTGGSAGTGLGAVRRISEVFDIVAWPGAGAAVLARIYMRAARSAGPASSPFGGVAVPMPGEAECGDAYCARVTPEGWTLVVADGLGHGPHAAEASEAAIRAFRANETLAPAEILGVIHDALRPTRGGAVSVARYDARRGVLVFAGIGNVMGAVVTDGEVRRTISLAGTAGHVARRIRDYEYPFEPGSLFVMHSDGIATSWSLKPYPGLVEAHPSLVAGVLYRDFARGRDDATVLVARGTRP